MAYSSIVKPSVYFNTKLYTGNGGANSITGVGFQPDLVWMKNRSTTLHHVLQDAVRGTTKCIYSNLTAAEETQSGSITAFASDGFTFGSGTMADVNGNGNSFASWNWKANGAGSANTDGSINTTATSVNTTAGFSISKYTGTGSNATVGHGLGVVPAVVIVKNLSNGSDAWMIYHKNSNATPEDYLLQFNTNIAAAQNTNMWNSTAPTSSVFSVGTENGVNQSSQQIIAYCFAEKTGYSKFGSYKGNGANFDNAFVYTGFKPSLVIIKKSNTTGNWVIEDNKRAGYNQANYHLYPNLTNAEGTNYYTDFLSNGFKIRDNPSDIGESGHTYIYMAFAEEPLVANSGSNGVPATAR